jgi:uncharacterized protein (TIGR00661 family)
MGIIFYNTCGEGLGHSARAASLIEYLPQHDFYIFTYSDGFAFMNSLNLPNVKQVFEIEGVKFAQNKSSVSTLGTIKNATKYMCGGLQRNLKFMQKKVDELKPDLILVDWEPTAPRIAAKNGITCISIDSQHKFRFSKLDDFPIGLRIYSSLVSLFSRVMIPNVKHYVLSTFQSDLIEKREKLTLSQCFIRKEIVDFPRGQDDCLLVYIRHEDIARKVLRCIIDSKTQCEKIVCYGVHLEGEFPSVEFKERSFSGFSHDLARCKAVFTTAGIQLIGEARYFGKPSFVVPLPGQQEQSVNARYVEIMKLGTSSTFKTLSPEKVIDFMNVYTNGIPFCENGVFEAVNVINNYLE